jgi:hypothetical protein
MSSSDIHFFLNLRNQLKLYHWQTHVYSRHIATDKIITELDESIDSFVEIYIGKYGRPKMTGTNLVIKLHNLTEAGATKLVNSAIKYMQGPLTKHLSKDDTELINLRDELIASLGQLLYLFTLK